MLKKNFGKRVIIKAREPEIGHFYNQECELIFEPRNLNLRAYDTFIKS